MGIKNNFQDTLMNRKFKRRAFMWNRIFL